MLQLADITKGFNPAQKKVITAPYGHLIVNAGAGTGKTTTLAARLLYLQMEMGIPSDRIMGVTFSRTAREHLLGRIEIFFNELKAGSNVPIYTYHGLAFRIARNACMFGETRLKSGFTVLTSLNRAGNRLFKEYSTLYDGLQREIHSEIRAEAYSKVIDLLRLGYDGGDPILSPKDLPDGYSIVSPANGAFIHLLSDDIKKVWFRYEHLMKRFNTTDYTGMLVEASLALKHPGRKTLERTLNGLQYIIADEYQDTSRLQESILISLAKEQVCINAVGDQNQTIYSFNGSTPSNIEDFSKRFSSTGNTVLEPIFLNENYRSSPNILSVAARIRELEGVGELVPSSSTLRGELENWRKKNYPVRCVLTPRITLAADYVACEIGRLIKEGVLPNEIAVLVRKDSEFSPQGKSVMEALEKYGIETSVQSHKAGKFELVSAVIEYCQEHLFEPLDDLIKGISSSNKVAAGFSATEIVIKLEEAIQAGAETALEAADFLFEELDEEAGNPRHVGGVKVRTIHSAKGEEYRVVFIMYLADSQFPHSSRPDIEEEKRLYYVGITRAMERLYILGHYGNEHDFFGDSEGEETVLVRHVVEGGMDELLDPQLRLEQGVIDSMQRTKEFQNRQEEKVRTSLRRQFEEEY